MNLKMLVLFIVPKNIGCFSKKNHNGYYIPQMPIHVNEIEIEIKIKRMLCRAKFANEFDWLSKTLQREIKTFTIITKSSEFIDRACAV